jgi:hypothetical protein
MSTPIIALVIGIGLSAFAAIVLVVCARKVRSANGSGMWSSDWAATLSSLALVGAIIVAVAWTMKGMMLLVPDQLIGSFAGFVASTIVLLSTLRIMGPLQK